MLKVAGVPQDDGGNHQIQPGRPVLLVFVGAVADFTQTMDEDGAGEAVSGFALVQLMAGLPAESRILQPVEGEQIASSDHHLERMIVTREDGEAVWAERRLDQAAWAVVRPVRSAFQFHGSRQSS